MAGVQKLPNGLVRPDDHDASRNLLVLPGLRGVPGYTSRAGDAVISEVA